MELENDQVDQILGTLLRAGVILSACVVLAGGVWHLARAAWSVPDYHIFRGEPADLRSVSGVVDGVFRGKPHSLIQLGLLLLIATPIARVAFSVFAFAVLRDWLYVAITLVVLTLLFSTLLGLTGAPT